MNNNTLSYYNRNAVSFVESTQLVQMTEAWMRFTSRLPSKAVLLDFGCGSGRDTKYFLEKGYSVEAIDGSSVLCEIASAYTGIHVEQKIFQEWKSKPKYDGIWACSSILHLKRNELQEVISNIKEALLPKGVFYTSFKYGEFEGERNGRYFIDFTAQSFDNFIKEVKGFEIIDKWITTDVRKGRESEKWLNVILQKI